VSAVFVCQGCLLQESSPSNLDSRNTRLSRVAQLTAFASIDGDALSTSATAAGPFVLVRVPRSATNTEEVWWQTPDDHPTEYAK
jgi:hypothetical protein